jgi:HAD superfamily phosphatase (TIGR01681 family)
MIPPRERPSRSVSSRETHTNNVVDVRIAANFTAEPIRATLDFWFDRLSLPARIFFAPYNQVFQQLLDPASVLGAGRDGYRVILIRIADWISHGDAGSSGDGEALIDIVTQFAEAVAAAAQRAGMQAGMQAEMIVVLCPDELDAASDAARHALLARLRTVPGVTLVDLADAADRYGVDEVVNEHGRREGHIPFSSAFFVAMGTIVARTIAALRRPATKVVVVDCDNTLWAGLCGEDGADGVSVTPAHAAVQARLRTLQRGGVLLCLCSKNSEASVLDVFERTRGMVLRLDDIAAHRINWLPKSHNVAALARELDLALDSVVFLDDSPSERAEIRSECPAVLVLDPPEDPREWPVFLDHVWALDTASARSATGPTSNFRCWTTFSPISR